MISSVAVQALKCEVIQIERERLEKFAHKGVSDRRNVSPRMWGVYNELLAVAETHTS